MELLWADLSATGPVSGRFPLLASRLNLRATPVSRYRQDPDRFQPWNAAIAELRFELRWTSDFLEPPRGDDLPKWLWNFMSANSSALADRFLSH